MIEGCARGVNGGGDFVDGGLQLRSRNDGPMLDLCGGAGLAEDCMNERAEPWAVRAVRHGSLGDPGDSGLGHVLWRRFSGAAREYDFDGGKGALIEGGGAV